MSKRKNNNSKNKAQTKVETKYFKDLINRNIYQVQEKNMKPYLLYSNRYTVSVMLGVLTYGFLTGIEASLFASVLLGLFLEIGYRRKFLPSLNIVNHVNLNKSISPQAATMNIGLYLVLTVILVLYAFNGEVSETSKWILLSFGVASLGISAMYIQELMATKQSKSIIK